MEEGELMKRFSRILVHVDTRVDDHPVLERAISLARSHGASLRIVDIVPEITWAARLGSSAVDEMRQSLVEKKEAALNVLASASRSQGISTDSKVLIGRTSAEICVEVEGGGHDLVMKDAKGPGSRRLGILGTSATRLMRFCPCTVWAFRRPQLESAGKIVAAVDVATVDERHALLNREILDVAAGLAQGIPHVVYAWSLYGEKLIKDYLKRDEFEAMVKEGEEQAVAKMAEFLGPFGLSTSAPQVHFLRGSEEVELARFVNEQQFEALVIGTVGRSGLSGILVGNTAEVLLDRVQCSVVAVKPAAQAG
jgi:nucleotide-binding universal stress UspA family protein